MLEEDGAIDQRVSLSEGMIGGESASAIRVDLSLAQSCIERQSE